MNLPAKIERMAGHFDPHASVYTDGITVSGRMRTLDDAKVAALAESIAAIGLINPLHVFTDPANDEVHLVAGAHRLAAVKSLGWDSIPCMFVGANDLDRQLVEIDENLIRAELSVEETRVHLLRRKELWELRQRECGKPLPTSEAPRTGRGHKGFAAETAAATGWSKRRINQLLADEQTPPKIVPAVAADDLIASRRRQLAELDAAWERADSAVRQTFVREKRLIGALEWSDG
jgi:ParB-like chromosome segregation protein Spo0J